MHRTLALFTSAALLASLAVATVAAPAAAGKPKCGGKVATIVGTNKSEVIRGTAKGDVIVAKGGNDRIYGRGGHDIICGNGGNDRIIGGAGNDRIFGGRGRDVMDGNPGNDVLFGGLQNDAFRGGFGVDACYQGTGSGPMRTCELGSVPWLAVAYSDMNGNQDFDTGDVMIAKVVDANGDGVASAGDYVVMGRYPTTFVPKRASDFRKWGKKWHKVTNVWPPTAPESMIVVSGDDTHSWLGTGATSGDPGASISEQYRESDGSHISEFEDRHDSKLGHLDRVQTQLFSPSRPPSASSLTTPPDGDDRFLDVEFQD